MARIGRRPKKKMKAKYKYVKKVNLTTTALPSAKRQRTNYKRQGGFTDEGATAIPAMQPSRIHLRNAIYYIYVNTLDAPHEEHWSGKEGTIAIIRKKLGLPPHTRRLIRRTLDLIISNFKNGTVFDGIHESAAGRPVSIKPGSVEETLIADWMEAHVGFRMTTLLVNEHRKEQGKERLSVSAVMSAFYRLQPKITVIEKVQSGGNNQNWKDASYRVAKQMQIMLGKLSDDEIMTDKEGTYYMPYRERNYTKAVIALARSHKTCTYDVQHNSTSNELTNT